MNLIQNKMMRNKLWIIIAACFFMAGGNLYGSTRNKSGYVVATSQKLRGDKEWMKVVDALATRHKATVLYYGEKPAELLEKFRELEPRYVAFVETPENLNREYVMDGHRLSRSVDDDIYADYMWGIITGYTPADAMRMVEGSRKPFVIRTALNTTVEMNGGKWFDKFAYMSDGGEPGGWGEKCGPGQGVRSYNINKWEILDKWVEKYKEIDPDLLITSSHATEKNLEMPFTTGNLKPKGGRLYADFITPEYLDGTLHPRVYYAAGNCLIGNVDNDPESMAVAWLSGAGATSMVGYVVTTWYGRNGWGGLKYWASNAGRLTLAQAVYLNQQDMLQTEQAWSPEMLKVEYPFTASPFGERDEFKKVFREATGMESTDDQMGFVHDRNVLAFYGDPSWDVKLQAAEPAGYDVKFEVKGRKCTITIVTNNNFNGELMKGGKIKQVHVADIPFAYYFPQRVKNPRLADGQKWDVAVAEDFLLVYNCDFEKNKSYSVVLDID